MADHDSRVAARALPPRPRAAADARSGELQPIDQWPVPTDAGSPGRYRSADGRPLHGFFRRVLPDGREEVKVICNGRALRAYPFASGPLPFESPMVRWRNLAMCGGYALFGRRGSEDDESAAIVVAMLEGLKPLGEALLQDDRAEDAASRGRAAGLLIEVTPRPDFPYWQPRGRPRASWFQVQLARPEPLGELFDLDAVVASYEALLRPHEGAIGVSAILHQVRARLKTESTSPLAAVFGRFDWSSPASDDYLVTTGLELGYPLQSTAALLVQELARR